MRDDQERLRDMQEAIERIERYAQQGREAFERDELIQTWIVYHLQVLGEAARSLSQTTRDCAPMIPWSQIIGMRNILVHHYFGIDQQAVWTAVERDIPVLKQQIARLLSST